MIQEILGSIWATFEHNYQMSITQQSPYGTKYQNGMIVKTVTIKILMNWNQNCQYPSQNYALLTIANCYTVVLQWWMHNI